MIDDFEENIEEIYLPEIKIYIGKENPVSKAKDFSIITAGFNGGLFALLGPKRMSYDRNIKLIQEIWEKILMILMETISVVTAINIHAG